MPISGEPIRILIVEDESAHAEVICRALKASALDVSIQLGASLRDYRLMVEVERPHIVLIDLNLPDGRAMEVLRAPAVAGDFPVLIMTSFGNEKMAVEAMKAGALDYIVKSPETFAEMPKIIERALREWSTLKEHQRIGEELRESERYLQTILQTTAEGFWIVDSSGKIMDVNEAYCRMSGYTRNEFLTFHISDIEAVETPAETAKRIQRILATGSEIFESRHRKKDGSVMDVEMSVTYLPTAVGGRLICFCRDITEKMKVREEADRNNRLAAVGELSAGIAHEINNPAGLILSNLETISEAFDDIVPILDDHYRSNGDFPFGGLSFARLREQFPEILRETGDSARRIRQIVEDLKNFSQGSSSRDLDDFLLREAVQRSVRLTATLWRQATQNFTFDLTEEVIMIHGCERRVEQVLVNLIANACQALPHRNCGITLSTRYDYENSAALIVLSDEGIGIPGEHLVRLATPFFTTRQGVGGTGLGLSVSFGIIKEHGGTIHFSSEPDKGTTVTVALPATLLDGAL